MEYGNKDIGVGATRELDLRVSVGALVAVLFNRPGDRRQMLALERTATLRESEGRWDVIVKAKPFGGSARIVDPHMLKDVIGDFHYDSEQSRQENDCRIQLRRSSWPTLKNICREALKETGRPILELSPHRELAEEFEDSLGIPLTPSQYDLKRRGLVIEDIPSATQNMRAPGMPTVRIYYIFEARIDDSALVELMLTNSRRYSERDLHNMAREDSSHGGRGRASALLVLDLDDTKYLYTSIPLERRSETVRFGEHQLHGNVPAVLSEIDHPKYQRYGS